VVARLVAIRNEHFAHRYPTRTHHLPAQLLSLSAVRRGRPAARAGGGAGGVRALVLNADWFRRARGRRGSAPV